MKKLLLQSLLCGTLALTAVPTTHAADAPSATMAREDAVLIQITASIEAIDHATREVTLKGPLGNGVTFTVDKRVKRLGEMKVGDLVRAEYFISIAAELRPPTAGEEKTPFVMLDAAGKAPAGTSPAAGGLRRFKVVTTVEGLDRPTRTVTVKGPRGNYFTARVADPERLTQMRIGEHIVLTCTEALAVSLEKTKAHKAE